ncbi:MAG TPA: glycerol dehydrogenase, partial [Gammaproteobacteria bacterium]|nr:glycerol dehydrogenase [Gammaproteobacteria bacterium]
GMGDAMATWYEARACYSNPAATTPVGGRPTLAAYAMSEICARTIYEYGEEAGAA